jgi:hypothetical protein
VFRKQSFITGSVCLISICLCSFLKSKEPGSEIPTVKAKIISSKGTKYKIQISLVNNSKDTLYYLGGNCGEWYFRNFNFDSNAFYMDTDKCDSSYLLKLKILPGRTIMDTLTVGLWIFEHWEANLTNDDRRGHTDSEEDLLKRYKGLKFKICFLWHPLKTNQLTKEDIGHYKATNFWAGSVTIWSNTLEIK